VNPTPHEGPLRPGLVFPCCSFSLSFLMFSTALLFEGPLFLSRLWWYLGLCALMKLVFFLSPQKLAFFWQFAFLVPGGPRPPFFPPRGTFFFPQSFGPTKGFSSSPDYPRSRVFFPPLFSFFFFVLFPPLATGFSFPLSGPSSP